LRGGCPEPYGGEERKGNDKVSSREVGKLHRGGNLRLPAEPEGLRGRKVILREDKMFLG